MRHAYLLTTVMLASCSSADFGVEHDDATASDSALGDTSVATDSTADSSAPGNIKCGPMVCAAGDVCCVASREAGVDLECAKVCGPDSGAPIACDGPEDCTPAARYCCGVFAIGPGTFPYCPRSVVGSKCAATCPTSIPFTCPNTGQVKLCHSRADCADDATAPQCCQFTDRGVSTTVCVPDAASGIADKCIP